MAILLLTGLTTTSFILNVNTQPKPWEVPDVANT